MCIFQLAKHFPGGQVKINVYATEAPNVTFYDGHSVRVKVGGNLEFFVESYGQVYPAFGLSFSISVDVSLVVQDKRITFRLNDLRYYIDNAYNIMTRPVNIFEVCKRLEGNAW